jgi:hypothetical protein
MVSNYEYMVNESNEKGKSVYGLYQEWLRGYVEYLV